jgi:hypothetical protein
LFAHGPKKEENSNEKTALLAVAVVFSEDFFDVAFDFVGGYAEEEK